LKIVAIKQDYYEVLGVPRNASDEEIKRAFRTLAKMFPKKEIAYKVTSPFHLRKRFSAALKKLEYNASSSALHAMASVANGEQIPRPAPIAAAQGK